MDALIDYSPLIIPFDGANNGTTFTEAKGHALTAIGTVVTSTTQAKFVSSGYFDGSGAAISTPHSADLGMTGQIDFCVEFWIYLPTGSTGGRVIGCGTNWVGVNWGVTIEPTLVPRIGWGNTTVTSSGLLWGTPLSTNAWNFVKVSATGTVLQCWVNGVSQGTGVIDDTLKPRVSQAGDFVLIGKAHDNTLPLNAYIDDLRVTIGNSRVATNTTVPTAAFQTTLLVRSGALSVSEVGSDSASFTGSSLSNKLVVTESGSDTCLINAYQTDALIANTQLLIHFDSGFVDEMGRTLTNHGVTTSSSPVKFGATAAYFNGSSWLSSPNSANLDIGAGTDFCIECWVYLPTGSTGGQIIKYGKVTNYSNWGLLIQSTGQISLSWGHSTSYQSFNLSDPAGIPRDQWVFLKVSKTGTQVKGWVNGANYYSPGTATVDTGYIPGASLWIGKNPESTLYFNGYIDDLRVTIGNSRASTDTLVPVAPFPNLLIVPAQASLSASESGQDIAAINGLVPVLGDLVVAELGSDVLSETGKTAVSGSLVVAEAITKDTLASSGKAAVLGSLDKAESGVDSLSANGKADVSGSLVVVETSADISVVQGSTGVLGVLCTINAYELIADNLFISANVIAAGKLETTETIDTFTWVGELGRMGSISSVESISKDSLFITGNVTASGSLNKTEATNDVADFVGVSDFFGQLIAVETGEDSFVVNNLPPIIGQLAATASLYDSMACYSFVGLTDSSILLWYDATMSVEPEGSPWILERVNNRRFRQKNGWSFDASLQVIKQGALGGMNCVSKQNFDNSSLQYESYLEDAAFAAANGYPLSASYNFVGRLPSYSQYRTNFGGNTLTIDTLFKVDTFDRYWNNGGVLSLIPAPISHRRLTIVGVYDGAYDNSIWLFEYGATGLFYINISLAYIADNIGAIYDSYPHFLNTTTASVRSLEPVYLDLLNWNSLIITKGGTNTPIVMYFNGVELGTNIVTNDSGAIDNPVVLKPTSELATFDNIVSGDMFGYFAGRIAFFKLLSSHYTGVGNPQYARLYASEGNLQASLTTYYLRGWDTTSANFVYWQSVGTPNISPTSTIPALVGTLTNVCVVGTMQS